MLGKALTLVKGHESKPYAALWVIVGLLYNFTNVKMIGPNKPLKKKLLPKNFLFTSFWIPKVK